MVDLLLTPGFCYYYSQRSAMPLPCKRTRTIRINEIFFLLLVSCWTFFPGNNLHSQCEATGPYSIPDEGTLTIDLLATGLVDGDLASATQGICGVEIDFMHEYLGDLTITVISPAGTVVQLAGPVNTAIDPTNLSRWNISFVPCATPAMPDAGFSGVWSNMQTWQVFTTYTGSYHPYLGCLEDFNTGSANGTWQIIFEDHDALQTGSIASIRLIFCNPTGLSCEECGPNGGTLTPSAIELCEGEMLLSSMTSVDFGSQAPDPVLYSYAFVFHNGNTIVESGTSVSHVTIPGSFSLCGVSYLISQQAMMEAILASGDYNQLVQAVNNNSVCATLSENCIAVNVTAIPDTAVRDILLCDGDVYVFKGQLYSTAGVYYVTVDGVGECDSIYRLNISQSNLMAGIAIPDTIACGGGGVLLNGNLSGGGSGPLSYEWTTSSGVLNGNLSSSQVMAMVPGFYTLTVRDNVCESSTDVIVHGDASYPQIYLVTDEITCADPVAKLRPVVVPSNVTYTWTGPGGFTSSSKNIDVTIAGRYFLRVVTPAGCESFTYVDVASNIVYPDATISLLDKACANNFGVLGVLTASELTYQWSGPGGPYPGNPQIGVAPSGNYSVTVTNTANGCESTDTYDYVADYTIPDISVVGIDSIRCSQEVALFVDPSGISNPPHWSGPNGFVTSGYNVSLSQPGVYIVSVVGTNGCKTSDSIVLVASNSFPDFEITNDTISCIDATATIGITMSGADVFLWPGLQPPQSANAFVQVSQPGSYNVIATDTNSGCQIKVQAQVAANISPPSFTYLTDTLSCNEPIGTLSLVPQGGQQYTSVQWQYPDMTIVLNNSIIVNEPGNYLLTVTGKNGCIDTTFVPVYADTVTAVFFLEPDTLGCDRMGIIHNIRVDTLIGIFWTGPNGFSSSEMEPMVTDTGYYTASGFADNGCPNEVTVHVSGDFEEPVSLLSLEDLTCLTPTAEFVAHTQEAVLSFTWFDPSGNIISMDSSAMVSEPGVYTLRVEGYNHCVSIDSIFLDPPDFPDIFVASDTLKCNQDTASIQASTNVMDASFAWMNADGDTLGKTETLFIDYTGPFTISVTGPNGCESRDTVTIQIDTSAAFANLMMNGEVRCQNRDFILDGSGSSPANITYHWSTTGGQILSSDTTAVVDARDTGFYYLTVINRANGCEDTDTIYVNEHPDAITQAFLEVQRPACSGDSNAVITVSGLLGGVGPIQYQLNSMVSQTSGVFEGLTSGVFLLQISDAAGCIYDSTVTIEPTNPYTVDAGPDLEIYIGETADLQGITDILPEEIFSQDWDSLGMLLCQDCPDAVVRPFVTTPYRFTVTSATGCVISDELTVFVIEKGKFFIPNIFSPNGDAVNDEIRFYASPGIEKVLRWSIFDRWGNLVFSRDDFDPGDPNVYWNGTAQGSEMLNPGVFPFVVEVELINGNTEVHQGSITLIR